jgi:hypothetical protein
MKHRCVSFGAMSPPISEQLPNLKKPEVADKAAKSITYLHIHGFLTDTEARKARERMVKLWEKNKL